MSSTTRCDVVAFGEVLVDLVPSGNEQWAYQAQAGGAPANLAAALATLGRRVALLGRIGSDPFGQLVASTLSARHIDISYLQRDPHAPTGLSVVGRANEDPPFVLYRNGAADGRVEIGARETALIGAARLLHIGSLLATQKSGRDALLQATSAAVSSGTVVSTDVNLRATGWSTSSEMLDSARELIATADVIKATHAELNQLELDLSDLRHSQKLWLVTDADRPARLVYGDIVLTKEVPRVPVVDATGAGDASFAALLHSILERDGDETPRRSVGELTRALNWAVIAGSIAVQGRGGMQRLATLRELPS